MIRGVGPQVLGIRTASEAEISQTPSAKQQRLHSTGNGDMEAITAASPLQEKGKENQLLISVLVPREQGQPSASSSSSTLVLGTQRVSLDAGRLLVLHQENIATFFKTCIAQLTDIHEKLSTLMNKNAIIFKKAGITENELKERLCATPIQESTCLRDLLHGKPEVATAIRAINRHKEFLVDKEETYDLTHRSNKNIKWIEAYVSGNEEKVTKRTITQSELNEAITRYMEAKKNALKVAIFAIGFLQYTPDSGADNNYALMDGLIAEKKYLQDVFLQIIKSNSTNSDLFSEYVRRFSEVPAEFICDFISHWRESTNGDVLSQESQHTINLLGVTSEQLKELRKKFLLSLKIPNDDEYRVVDEGNVKEFVKTYNGMYTKIDGLEKAIDGLVYSIHTQYTGTVIGIEKAANMGYQLGYQEGIEEGIKRAKLELTNGEPPSLYDAFASWWYGSGQPAPSSSTSLVRTSTAPVITKIKLDDIKGQVMNAINKVEEGQALTLD